MKTFRLGHPTSLAKKKKRYFGYRDIELTVN